MQSNEPRFHFRLLRPLERSDSGSVSSMKRLPPADPPVLKCFIKDCKTCTGRRVLCVTASIPLLGVRSLEGGSDKGQTKAPATTSDCSGLHCRVVDFRYVTNLSLEKIHSVVSEHFSLCLYPGPFAFRSIYIYVYKGTQKP